MTTNKSSSNTRRRRKARTHSLLVFFFIVAPCAVNALISITTFNLLAAVHHSIMPPTLSSDYTDFRESDNPHWWKPRAKKVAQYIATELATSDIVLLQEWWTRPEYERLISNYTSHLFGRVAHVRPGMVNGGQKREDGLAVLIHKNFKSPRSEDASLKSFIVVRSMRVDRSYWAMSTCPFHPPRSANANKRTKSCWWLGRSHEKDDTTPFMVTMEVICKSLREISTVIR
eukprot:CAMPEP_0178904954 /NCGR_PEP_ID=MMETSP0786-20121207/5983_1 /TAXON_ID=186022 /ORGANISM="Thalassionema frauenfeldii, Strain CCMP 1798" /LENGTH=228 /DNA_ID=CAMNT_0020576461 /DNA_START=79 /DNA_END=762 /DNA_ORIENTATION=-